MEVTLFTPGPVTTSFKVKQATQVDSPSRDHPNHKKTLDFVRKTIAEVAAPNNTSKYTTVLIPGTGTYVIESVFINAIGKKKGGKFLIISNGAFGDRMLEVASQSEYQYDYLKFDVNEILPVDKIEKHLIEHGSEYTVVGFVHSETSTGTINPVSEIARLVKRHTKAFLFLDAMSSLGAIPVDMDADKIDFLSSTSGKCFQGIPGISFIVCNLESLMAIKGRCPSFSFDWDGQWTAQEKHGNFRTTSIIHVLLALEQALREYLEEGGLSGRRARYMKNRDVLRYGMKRLGFKTVLNEKTHESWILTNFLYLDDPKFDFRKFFQELTKRGQIINPHKFVDEDAFRVGTIGNLFPEDFENFLKITETILVEMGVNLKN